MANVSVIVITHNEERNIVECLCGVAWADEIVVVDACSSDQTAELARQFTSRVFTREWIGYADAKNFALSKVRHDWVLWLDADERIPPELADEIRRVVADAPALAAYQFARRAYFLGKWIKHCGWYPGYVVRLFRKDHAGFSTDRVHEKLIVDGNVGTLQHDMLHYTDENLFHYFAKFNRYTSLAADDLHHAGKKFTWYSVLARPPFLFFKMFILRRGFLDGVHGLLLSIASAAYVFVKYAKLWDLQRLRRGDDYPLGRD